MSAQGILLPSTTHIAKSVPATDWHCGQRIRLIRPVKVSCWRSDRNHCACVLFVANEPGTVYNKFLGSGKKSCVSPGEQPCVHTAMKLFAADSSNMTLNQGYVSESFQTVHDDMVTFTGVLHLYTRFNDCGQFPSSLPVGCP